MEGPIRLESYARSAVHRVMGGFAGMDKDGLFPNHQRMLKVDVADSYQLRTESSVIRQTMLTAEEGTKAVQRESTDWHKVSLRIHAVEPAKNILDPNDPEQVYAWAMQKEWKRRKA